MLNCVACSTRLECFAGSGSSVAGCLSSAVTNSIVPQSSATRRDAMPFALLNSKRRALSQPIQATLRCSNTASAAQVTGTKPLANVKSQLLQAVEGTDRGIFGVKAITRQTILTLIEELEEQNALKSSAQNLATVAGAWRLLYSTITIQGAKRTKLGLREVVRLGEFEQHIDTENSLAVNKVHFNVMGFSRLSGMLTVEASFQPVSPARVDITYNKSTLVPSQLQQLFEKNFDLLLNIFNPAGWLDITYVDQEHRVGRDDKGNVFLLERMR